MNAKKHTMELVWHSCTDCLPEEKYNACLYVTDGERVVAVEWNGSYFMGGGLYIRPGMNSGGFWWADLIQTVNGFAPIQEFWS